ncbi:flavin reductase family protein [Haloimpatiens sp. FM7330]|uniref:flavin reductase family protein n=1 Tax=Haloimpatiens sp. FM7330 TaxID=3298610 RepID=UPI003638FE32
MEINYTENLQEAFKYIQKQGAFLTVKDKNGKVNTMTIGWANIGFEWGKPVFTVLVRKQRYTHELIENAQDFTVCIPLDEDMKEALKFCGTKSGRDFDKFEECNLKVENGKKVESPVIGNCGLTYECKIAYKHEMSSKFLRKDIKDKWYKAEDYHVIYYGEIVDCYMNK